MIKHPYDIESPSVKLGEYKGWVIYIGKARGEVEDGDTLSLHATNGNVSFDSAFGQYVPRGQPFITPKDDEVKKELDDMKKRLDNYEFKQMIKQSEFDPEQYIKGWKNR